MIPGPDDLWFLPLGGTGEIGMNLNLYGHDGRWLMVDCGVTFAGPRPAHADVVAGDWWPADYAGPALVSMEADGAEGLGLAIGDRINREVVLFELSRDLVAQVDFVFYE